MMEERIEQTFETGDHAEVSIENVQGGITVEGWDEPRVHMIARRQGERARVVFSHEGHRVDVRTEIEPRGGGMGGWFSREDSAQVDYQLRVPRATQLRMKNVQGAIRGVGLQGSVEAKSVDGSVHVSEVMGDTRLEATNGSVELTSAHGQAQAFTTNGSIALRDNHLERVIAETVNGSIRLDPLTPNSEVRARSVNGELHLTVPDGVQAELDASGVMLRTSIGLPHQKNAGGRASWRGVVGSGQAGARVTFTTVNGHVRVTGGQAVSAEAPGVPAGSEPAASATSATPATPATPTHASHAAHASHPAAPDQPQDVMSVLQAIERGEISVEQGLELMKKLG